MEAKKYSMLKPWICFLWIIREWNSEVNFIWNLKFVLLFMEESNEYCLWRRRIIISFKTRRTWMYVTGSKKTIFLKEISKLTKYISFLVQNRFFSVGMHSRARAKIFVAFFFVWFLLWTGCFYWTKLLAMKATIGNRPATSSEKSCIGSVHHLCW